MDPTLYAGLLAAAGGLVTIVVTQLIALRRNNVSVRKDEMTMLRTELTRLHERVERAEQAADKERALRQDVEDRISQLEGEVGRLRVELEAEQAQRAREYQRFAVVRDLARLYHAALRENEITPPKFKRADDTDESPEALIGVA